LKHKKSFTVGTVPKFNGQIVEIEAIPGNE
jgi:hypothetical protein